MQKILDDGLASVDELEDATKLYLGFHPQVKEGYPCYLTTFFGDEKGLWIEAVRTIRARREKAAAKAALAAASEGAE